MFKRENNTTPEQNENAPRVMLVEKGRKIMAFENKLVKKLWTLVENTQLHMKRKITSFHHYQKETLRVCGTAIQAYILNRHKSVEKKLVQKCGYSLEN